MWAIVVFIAILWVISIFMQLINTPYRTLSSKEIEELKRQGRLQDEEWQ